MDITNPFSNFVQSIAANLATDLVKLYGKKLDSLLYGDQEHRDLVALFNDALVHLFPTILPNDTPDLWKHYEDILSQFLLNENVAQSILEYILNGQRIPISELEIEFNKTRDSKTFPFSVLMQALSVSLNESLLKAAAKPGSTLFPKVSLGLNERILKQQTEILELLRKKQPSKTVFISYARADGREHAALLRNELTSEGYVIWQDIISLVAGEGWWQQIEKAISDAHAAVLIVTKKALTSKGVAEERKYARRIGKRIIYVTFDADIFSHAPIWVSHNHTLVFAEGHPDYDTNWKSLLEQLQTNQEMHPVPDNMAPSLSRGYVQRPEKCQEIKGRLLADNGVDPRLGVTTVLCSEGGYGKTTLAMAIYYDDDIQIAYADGILWLTIGQDPPSILELQMRLILSLDPTQPEAKSVTRATDVLHQLLENRQCLLVLDDVWDVHIIDSFPMGTACSLLLTTRVPYVAALDEQGAIDVGAMTVHQAGRMLISYLPARLKRWSTDIPDTVFELVTELGRWPLLINIIGGSLRQEMSIPDQDLTTVIEQIRQDLVEAGLSHFDRNDSKERNDALANSMAYSLKRFAEQDQHRLFELAIFREEENTPDKVVWRLWKKTGGHTQAEARKLIGQFDIQFYQRRKSTSGEMGFEMHDQVRDYLRNKLGAQPLISTHLALLDSYNPMHIPWHEIADDGYLYDHLAYHLHESGRDNELEALFDDDKWLKVRFDQNEYTYSGYIADLVTAWKMATDPHLAREISAAQEPTSLVRCIRYALITTSIHDLSANYEPELVMQAVTFGLWTIKRALSIIPNLTEPLTRFRMCATFLRSDNLSDRQLCYVQINAFKAARSITDFSTQSNSLAELAGIVTGEEQERVLHEALKVARVIKDEYDKTRTLIKLIEQFSGAEKRQVMKEALRATRVIRDAELRSHALATLAEQLSAAENKDLLVAALEATRALEHDDVKATALIKLAEQFSKTEQVQLLNEALTAGLVIEDEQWRSFILSAIVGQLSATENSDILQTVLAAARSVHDEGDKSRVLIALVGKLGVIDHKDLVREALDAIRAIKDENYKPSALAELAELYSGQEREKLMLEALEAARFIEDVDVKAATLTDLADLLSEAKKRDALKEALEAALSITEEDWRLHALADLAWQVNEIEHRNLLQKVLEAVLVVENGQAKSRTLASLAKQFTGNDQGKVLQAALTSAQAVVIDDYRWCALSDL